MKNVDKYFLRQSAQNIAQSGANLALGRLSGNKSWRSGYAMMDMFGGKVNVALVDTTFKSKYVVKITSVGITDYGKSTERREKSVAYFPSGFIPAALKAAITTNNPVRTLGNLIIDGRDHKIDGTLVASAGTLGIWTTQGLSQSGSSTIGGTTNGTDYVPSKPGNANIIKTSQTWPGGYPGSPDSVLGGPDKGYSEGTLKAMAISGIGGSQYTTNPSTLTRPFKGVTYVELQSGGLWQSMDISGSGILIVHNGAKNAGMKNLNSGTFTGLIIADDVVHIHTNIIGGLIGLTSTPSEGNCIGNGNGTVMYSTEAIIAATGNAGNGAANGNGSGAGVIAWWE